MLDSRAETTFAVSATFATEEASLVRSAVLDWLRNEVGREIPRPGTAARPATPETIDASGGADDSIRPRSVSGRLVLSPLDN
jgi:hypothetical protein